MTRVVAMEAVAFANIQQPRGKIVDLAAERIAHRKLLSRAHQRGIVGRLTGELATKVGQRLCAGGIEKQSPDDIQKIVARGPLNRPGFSKPLRAKENLLGHDPGIRASRAQTLKILQRIAESIGMIDSKSAQAP